MLPPRNAPFQKLLSRNTNTTALHTADYLRCFRPGNRFSKMAPGILNAVFVIFLSFGSLDPLVPILHLPVDLSFFIADAYFHSRYHVPDSPKHPCRWSESEFPLPRIPYGQRGKPAPGCPSAATGSRCSWGWMGL